MDPNCYPRIPTPPPPSHPTNGETASYTKPGSTDRRPFYVALVVCAALIVALSVGLIVHFHTDCDSKIEETPTVGSLVSSDKSGVLVNCLPDSRNIDDDVKACADRGCVWKELSDPDAPSCTYPDTYGYRIASGPETTPKGYRVTLSRVAAPEMFGDKTPAWDQVTVEVSLQTNNRVRIKFSPKDRTPFEVPQEALDIEGSVDSTTTVDTANYDVTFNTDPTFGIVVKRKDSNYVIFDTTVPGTILSDQFHQLTTRLSNHKLYGFGEHRHESFQHDLNWRTWTIFTRDAGPNSDFNLYGHHPVYLNVEDDGKANVIMLKNSNAMGISLQPFPGAAITYRTIGGVLDFYIYLGDSAADAVSNYVMSLGKPVFPPYWSLGFHLSRWGYKDIQDMKDIIERTIESGIPYEAQWADIDTFHKAYVYSYDKTSWKGFPKLVNDLRANNRHFITIVDPGIGANQSTIDEVTRDFPGWEDWVDRGTYVKADDNATLIGEVWPGITYYPDYTHPDTQQWWTDGINFYRNNVGVKVDALWIDMNEPSSFIKGSTVGCKRNDWNYPPYVPPILGSDDGSLFDKTICMDAQQYWGKHYDVHGLYAHSMALRTFNSLAEVFPNKRPWAMTRSSFVGTGSLVTKWQGDNQATWDNMRFSIIHLFEFGIFGFPMNGADICGFWLEPTTQLCIRWHQLGAFYPFSRNHNGLGDAPQVFEHQDPARFGQTFVDTVKPVMMTRQKLLPYLYTLMYNAHTKGDMVFRPLLIDFPEDEQTYTIQEQFMLGPALMSSPVLYENATEVEAYFPAGRWFDYISSAEVRSSGETKKLHTPLDRYNLHVRGGHILPFQAPAPTTVESRKKSLGLLVALDETRTANGELFWDDGETVVNEGPSKNYLLFKFEIPKAGELRIVSKVTTNQNFGNLKLEVIEIYGLDRPPSDVTINFGMGERLVPEANIKLFKNIAYIYLDNVQLNILRQEGNSVVIKWASY